jgi:hypothetical protein
MNTVAGVYRIPTIIRAIALFAAQSVELWSTTMPSAGYRIYNKAIANFSFINLKTSLARMTSDPEMGAWKDERRFEWSNNPLEELAE